jgi:hypothetical protein
MKTYLVTVTTSWAFDWSLKDCETRKIMTENVTDIFKLIASDFENNNDVIVSNVMIEPFIPLLEEIDAQKIKDYLIRQQKENWEGWYPEQQNMLRHLIESIRKEAIK